MLSVPVCHVVVRKDQIDTSEGSDQGELFQALL